MAFPHSIALCARRNLFIYPNYVFKSFSRVKTLLCGLGCSIKTFLKIHVKIFEISVKVHFFVPTYMSYLLSILSQLWLQKTPVCLRACNPPFRWRVKYYSHYIHSDKMPAAHYHFYQQWVDTNVTRPQQKRKTAEGSAGNQRKFSPVLFKPIT